MLDHLLALLRGHAPLLGNDVTKHQVDLPSHVGRVTADVEVGLLLEQLADKLGVLLQAVLDVDLFGTLARERGDDLQRVTELILVGLESGQQLFCITGVVCLILPSTHRGR